MQSKYFPVRLLWKYQTLLFVHCNIPQGVFCEQRSQKTRDIPREFAQSARILCIAKRTVILQLF